MVATDVRIYRMAWNCRAGGAAAMLDSDTDTRAVRMQTRPVGGRQAR